MTFWTLTLHILSCCKPELTVLFLRRLQYVAHVKKASDNLIKSQRC